MKFLPNWLRSSSSPKPVTSDRSLLTAKSAQDLLFPHQQLLVQIRSQVCVPESHWKTLYQSFIESFAAIVQELPASESHHHSQLGGLLLHCLEVGLHALQLRSGKMLPLGASPEVISEKQEIWSYAVLTAAMMHDIGKPLVDQKIIFYNHSNKPERWKAFTGALKIGVRYEVEFRVGRKYALHETIPSLLASQLVSVEGLNWLSSDMDVLEAWMLCLSGRKNEAGILGEIITQADQLSVAENLSGSAVTVQSMPTAQVRQVPLHQRLITGLRYLLDNDQLPLNRKGAAGWEYDGKLWLVSKRVLDDMRKHLITEGQSGIPSDNTRLMDELLQHGELEATEDRRAIWKVTISIEDWKQDFTCLCFSLDKLWSNKEKWPVSTGIQLSPCKNNRNTTSRSDKTSDKMLNKQNNKAETVLVDTEGRDAKSLTSKPHTPIDSLPLPPGVEIAAKSQLGSQNERPKEDHSTLAQAFIDWLSEGIASGSISVNHVGATIHIVEEGLLLVSPAIFRQYAKRDKNNDYAQIQHAFQSLGINKITPENTNVWKYVVQGKRKKATCLKGMLIHEPEKSLNIRLPPPNPVLTLES